MRVNIILLKPYTRIPVLPTTIIGIGPALIIDEVNMHMPITTGVPQIFTRPTADRKHVQNKGSYDDDEGKTSINYRPAAAAVADAAAAAAANTRTNIYRYI